MDFEVDYIETGEKQELKNTFKLEPSREKSPWKYHSCCRFSVEEMLHRRVEIEKQDCRKQFFG